jgi:hypothetical protein
VIGLALWLGCAGQPPEGDQSGRAPESEAADSGAADGDAADGGATDSDATDGGALDSDPAGDDAEDAWSGADDRDYLARLSLDLRGVRPTVEEIEAVEADPAALEGLIEDFLVDPRFSQRAREAWGEVLLTRQDTWPVDAASFGLSDEAAFALSVGEEPLRLIQRVIEEDRPWYEVVTADWTVVNEPLAAAWPVDYPEGAEGWQVVAYTDGRPAAGLLSTNGLWWRYRSTDGNANRGRANAISRALLCNDYLEHPITFSRDVDLLDEEAVLAAVREEPSCVACHATLDPIAAYLFGFYQYLDYSPPEMTRYHPEREWMWEDVLEVAPGWYGAPGYSLADLGQQIAGDDRLVSCAVERTFEILHQREPGLEHTDALVRYREAFLDGGLTIRALARAVVSDPQYRAVREADGGGPRLLSVDQLSSAVEELTGFRLVVGGVDQLASPSLGVRALAGGADGAVALAAAEAPSATTALVGERLAEGAAAAVVAADLEAPDAPRLFTEVAPDFDLEADPERGVAQIQALHLRILTDRVEADGEAVAANLELWRALRAINDDPREAWTGLVVALLRDPEMLVY